MYYLKPMPAGAKTKRNESRALQEHGKRTRSLPQFYLFPSRAGALRLSEAEEIK